MIFKRLKTIILALAIAFIAIPSNSTYASANDFSFSNFSADYYLSRSQDGTSHLHVVENLTAIFPETNQNHGIERYIPYTNQAGTNLTMASRTNLTITVLRNGKPEPYTYKSENGTFVVRIGDSSSYVHGEQTYTLEYDFQNVITEQDASSNNMTTTEFPANWQELYWDTNGTGWAQTFDHVEARVHLLDDLQNDVISNAFICFAGAYGTNRPCDQALKTTDGYTFTEDNLSSYQNLTFAIAFQPNTFTQPTPAANYIYLIAFIIFIIGVIITIIIICSSWKKCQEKYQHYKTQFVKPEYAPDPNYTVADIATNYMRSVTSNSINVATLMELAVTGKIAISKTQKKSLLRTINVWTITIKNTDLTEFQSTILKILNGNAAALIKDQVIEIDTHSTYRSTYFFMLKNAQEDINKRLEAAGVLEPPDSTNPTAAIMIGSKNQPLHKSAGAVSLLALIWGILIFCSLMLVFVTIDDTIVHYVFRLGFAFSTIPGSLILCIVCTISAKKINSYASHTIKGLDLSRFTDGLKLYTGMAESERISFLQSVNGADTTNEGVVKLYEKLLPYAIIFNQEKSWVKEMAKYYEMPDVTNPTWYNSDTAFSAIAFSQVVNSISASTIAAISHSCDSSGSGSSSGSGFSSSGHSGGGGGGGGGGGW